MARHMLSAFFCLVFFFFASLISDARGKVIFIHCFIISFLYCFYHDFFLCIVFFWKMNKYFFLMPISSYSYIEYFFSLEPLHFNLALTRGGRLEKFLNSSYMIVNQLKLMSASPAFKIDQKFIVYWWNVTAKTSMYFCCIVFGQ